jgi:hypothetical protein|tara:strand:+ start:114 stop:419 length:306 start_codon:yes stop_codon:yes gene_type:complete
LNEKKALIKLTQSIINITIGDKTMEKSKKVSKRDKVLAHLVSGKELTPLDALSLYGSYRLGAIIFDLRQDGYNIKTDIAKGTRHAIYSLIKSDNKEVFDSK